MAQQQQRKRCRRAPRAVAHTLAGLALCAHTSHGFAGTASTSAVAGTQQTYVVRRVRADRHACTVAVSAAAAAVVETPQDVDVPSDLASACGIDYVPLATMLATGDFKSADQFTRDALISAAGEGSKKRGFVYWTDVKKIPNEDLSTIENLWLKYSNGKFGYSVQADVWKFARGDFENFCRRIGWTTKNEEIERKLRWFGANEFIYDLERAPRGHLPLTSALRGTQLLKELLSHPLWSTEWKK